MSAEYGHAEAGLRGHRISERRYVPGFLSNDPFTPSIIQSIRNHRISRRIQGMDDVGLPHLTEPRNRYPHRLETQQIPILPTQPTQKARTTRFASDSAPPQRHRAYRAAYAPVSAWGTQPAPSTPQLSLASHPDPVTPVRTLSRSRSSGSRKASLEQPPVVDGADIQEPFDNGSSSKRRQDRSYVPDSPSHSSQLHSVHDSISHQDRFGRQNSYPASAHDSTRSRTRPSSPSQLPSRAPDEIRVPENDAYTGRVELFQRFDLQPDVKGDRVPSEYLPPPRRPSVHETYPHVESMDNEPLTIRDYVLVFITDTLPRQIYLHLLLRLPYLYFSRVNRIFQEVDLTLEEVKEMALQACAEDNKTFQYNMSNLGYYPNPGPTSLPPAYQRLKSGWEHFIDDLMREWKTLNIISVLLLSAIMTMFQVQSAASDPVTRYIAFWSLICALMSLLYGCLFIIRFGTMRKASKAAEWALEARKSQTIFWNVWVLLAMPAVWLSWSLLTFIACLMSFMWRAKANLPSDFVFSEAPSTELAFRIFICDVLGTGLLYSVLIINTFRHYGAQMDEAWQRRVRSFILSADPSSTPPPPPSWQFAQYPPPSPITPGPIAHQPSPPSRSRRVSDSDSGQTPYLAAGIGSRDLIGEWFQSKSAPQGIINAISPPTRSKSSLGRSLEHRPAHWYYRSYSPRNKSRSSSPGRSSSRSARTRSPPPQPIEHEKPPHSSTLPHVGTGPSMSSVDLQPQAKEERKNNGCSRSPNRDNRPASLDGGALPIPPAKIPGELSQVANIPVAEGEPEKLSSGYSQTSSRSPASSESFEGRLEVSEHQ